MQFAPLQPLFCAREVSRALSTSGVLKRHPGKSKNRDESGIKRISFQKCC